jgi:hypothetical protein
VGTTPVHDEFQAGSCSTEASSLDGGLSIARVRACGSLIKILSHTISPLTNYYSSVTSPSKLEDLNPNSHDQV